MSLSSFYQQQKKDNFHPNLFSSIPNNLVLFCGGCIPTLKYTLFFLLLFSVKHTLSHVYGGQQFHVKTNMGEDLLTRTVTPLCLHQKEKPSDDL